MGCNKDEGLFMLAPEEQFQRWEEKWERIENGDTVEKRTRTETEMRKKNIERTKG